MDIYVKIDDGAAVPINECDWLWRNPDGHIVGACLAEFANTEEEAWKEFSPRKYERTMLQKWGFTMTLIRHRDYGEIAMKCMTSKCDCPKDDRFRVCHECRRIGVRGFRTEVIEGKPRTMCVGKAECRKRRWGSY